MIYNHYQIVSLILTEESETHDTHRHHQTPEDSHRAGLDGLPQAKGVLNLNVLSGPDLDKVRLEGAIVLEATGVLQLSGRGLVELLVHLNVRVVGARKEGVQFFSVRVRR